VICDEISVPPPEFCSSDSMDKRNTHWSFYGSTGINNARRIGQLDGEKEYEGLDL
jgi:hypothetical protein